MYKMIEDPQSECVS